MKVLILGLFVLQPLVPAADNEQDLAEGKALYRSNCAFCHGLTGGGGRGPALAGRQLLHGSTPADIREVVSNGVPGSNMPAFEDIQKDEMDRLIAFVLQMSSAAGAKGAPAVGDATKGRQVYDRSGCANCHSIGDRGSVYGPDLTRIGAGRSGEYLRESLLNPSADIPEEYQGVTVITRDGKRVSGLRVNEDTFSVQLRDIGQKFRMFQKDQVREVVHETKSLMPAYTSLPRQDLDNLLAYLDTLRGGVNAGADVKKAEGIR